MSFQKYIANITEKTGKTPEKIREDVRSQGVIVEDMTATVFYRLLKKRISAWTWTCNGNVEILYFK